MHDPNLFNAPRFDDVPLFANTQINKESKQEFISKRIVKLKVHVHTMTMRPKEKNLQIMVQQPTLAQAYDKQHEIHRKMCQIGLKCEEGSPI
jgi:hypothetical protein